MTVRIPDAPALDLYRKKLKIIGLLMLIAGCIGVSAYIVLATVLGGENGEAPKWVNAFLIFAVPFALGLIATITFKRLHTREKASESSSECQFYSDCFICRSASKINPSETKEKFFYSDAVLKKENEKYGYIFVFGKGLFLVFSKEGLTEGELNAIRKNFRQQTFGEVAELKNYKSNEENNK